MTMYINQIYTSLSSGILFKHMILPTVSVMAKPKEIQQNIILATLCTPPPKFVTCKNKQQLLAYQGLPQMYCSAKNHIMNMEKEGQVRTIGLIKTRRDVWFAKTFRLYDLAMRIIFCLWILSKSSMKASCRFRCLWNSCLSVYLLLSASLSPSQHEGRRHCAGCATCETFDFGPWSGLLPVLDLCSHLDQLPIIWCLNGKEWP